MIIAVIINKYGNGFIFSCFIYLSIINKKIVISQNIHVGLAYNDSFIFPVNRYIVAWVKPHPGQFIPVKAFRGHTVLNNICITIK